VGDVDEIGRGASRLPREHPTARVGPPAARHRVELLLVPADPAGNFVEYYSDLDVIVDEEGVVTSPASGRRRHRRAPTAASVH